MTMNPNRSDILLSLEEAFELAHQALRACGSEDKAATVLARAMAEA